MGHQPASFFSMKRHLHRFVLAAALAASGGLLPAQESESKTPVSKLFLSETVGSGHIENNGQVYEPKQGAAFSAKGTVMVTGKESHQTYVLSSGTSLYLAANTQVQIDRFEQEHFSTLAKDESEPSVSHAILNLTHGTVATCASRMMSGTTLVYATPLARINVRGRRVVINVAANATTISSLEGSVTVRTGAKEESSVTLQPGEQAVVTAGPTGEPQAVVGPIDHDTLGGLDVMLNSACQARRTVAFDVATGEGGDEVVAHPTVTAAAPTNLTVSPDRLNPGQ
jgi:hypothetical protein